MSADKAKIREDYLHGFSVRMLAAKYDVPKSTIGRWVKKYGWVQETKTILDQEGTRDGTEWDSGTWDTKQAPLPADDDYSMLRGYTVKLLSKANDLLDLDDALAPRDLKSLSSMLLDVRTLMGIMSPREAAEQEMRLIALRKSVEQADATTEPVRIEFVNTEEAES